MGTKFDWDHFSGGFNFMVIVCPGGQEVGGRKSGGQMGSGPNVSQPIIFMQIHKYFDPIVHRDRDGYHDFKCQFHNGSCLPKYVS